MIGKYRPQFLEQILKSFKQNVVHGDGAGGEQKSTFIRNVIVSCCRSLLSS